MQYLILTKDQAKQLMDEINAAIDEAFASGRASVTEANDKEVDDAYDAGFEDGRARGYDEGHTDGSGDSYDDGYSDGYENGYQEAELRAAESAAFAD